MLLDEDRGEGYVSVFELSLRLFTILVPPFPNKNIQQKVTPATPRYPTHLRKPHIKRRYAVQKAMSLGPRHCKSRQVVVMEGGMGGGGRWRRGLDVGRCRPISQVR